MARLLSAFTADEQISLRQDDGTLSNNPIGLSFARVCRKCSCFGEFAIFIGTQNPHKAYKNSPSSAAGYKSDVWSCDLRVVGLCLTVAAGGCCCCCSWWDVVEPVSGTLTDWFDFLAQLQLGMSSGLCVLVPVDPVEKQTGKTPAAQCSRYISDVHSDV